MIRNPVLYSGTPSADKPTTPVVLPDIDFERALDPSGYIADPALTDAVNVALMLRQPLLLTGDPGTGKTRLAYSVAYELGLDPPLVFETKSTTISRDLFYTFDSIRRFQASHASDADLDPRRFIEFHALGKAILRTLPPAQRSRYAAAEMFDAQPAQQSVVLIDEIDKASRDFPNDILNEIENLYFRVSELSSDRIEADRRLRPIVIITSNSEKGLPDAFLRRCIFYHIPFPDPVRLENILLARIPSIHAAPRSFLGEVLEFFLLLRSDEVRLLKPPGTAELINWVGALLNVGVVPTLPLHDQLDAARRSLSTLAKNKEDQPRARSLFDAWSSKKT